MRDSKRCKANEIQRIPRLIIRTCHLPRNHPDAHSDTYGEWESSAEEATSA